jgi:hypothetical protein
MLILQTKYYFHRWVIFLLDVVICVSSLALYTVLFYYHKPTVYILEQVGIHAQLILALSGVFHLLLRPHMGIVRQMALYDLVKILVVQFLVVLLGLIVVFELHQQGQHG